jgi:hypothetical protein
MDDYDSDIEELSQSSFNEHFETKDDLSPIESSSVVDVFLETATRGKVRRKIRSKSVMDKNDPPRLLAVPTPSRPLQRRLNARSPVVSPSPRRHPDDVESSQRSLVSGSRKGKAKVTHTEDDSDDGFAPISPPPARLTSDDESSIPDSVEGFGELFYRPEGDSHIGQKRPDEVEFDPGLDGGNDFLDAGSDRDNDFDNDLGSDEDDDQVQEQDDSDGLDEFHTSGEEDVVENNQLAGYVSPVYDDPPRDPGTLRMVDDDGQPRVKPTTVWISTIFSEGYGCTEEEHEQQLAEHMTVEIANTGGHHDLNWLTEMSGLARVENVLASADVVGHRHFRAQEFFQDALEGRKDADVTYPPRVCMEHHRLTLQQAREQSHRIYDIDSCLSWATSLAVANQGFNFHAIPHPTDYLSNIHLEVTCTYYSGTQAREAVRPVHLVPHFLLGRIKGALELSVYIVFPQMYHPHRNTAERLTDEEAQYWYDFLFYPALRAVVRKDISAAYPPSFAEARNKARANSKEHIRATDRTPAPPRQMMISNIIQAQYLGEVWEKVQSNCRVLPEESPFQNPRLLISGKNLKNFTKDHNVETSSAQGAWTRFQTFWQKDVNELHVSRNGQYFDLGQETVEKDLNDNKCYVLRTCCQKRLKKCVDDFEQEYEGSQCAFDLYRFGLLKECSGSTITTRSNGGSQMYNDGFIYGQCYMKIKEIFDANKKFPLAEDALESLAYGRDRLKSVQRYLCGNIRTYEQLLEAYKHGKERIRSALQNMDSSFGVRLEMRLSKDLVEEVCSYMDWMQEANIGNKVCFFSVESELISKFIHQNVNRFMAPFEYMLSATTRTRTQQQVDMMMLMVRSMKYAYGSRSENRRHTGSLFWDEKPGNSARTTRHGVGMYSSIVNCGFGWWKPKINWSEYRWKDRYLGRMHVGGDGTFENARRQEEVHENSAVMIEIDYVRQWYEHYGVRSERAKVWLLNYLAWKSFTLFRKQTWQSIPDNNFRSGELKTEARGMAAPLDRPSFQRYLRDGTYEWRSGRRRLNSDGFDMSSPGNYADYFFGSADDGRNREHIEAYGFRMMFKSACIWLDQALGVRQRIEWVDQVQSAFLHCHLVFPASQKGHFIGRMGSTVRYSFLNSACGVVDGAYNDYNLFRDRRLGSLQQLSHPDIGAWDCGRNENERLKGRSAELSISKTMNNLSGMDEIEKYLERIYGDNGCRNGGEHN